MKRVLQAICMLALLLTTSCKKLGKLKEFDLHYNQEFVIPANNGGLTLPIEINSQDITTNTSSDYENQGTATKLVESVYLTELFFKVKTPSSGNFNFLKSVEIYLSSPNNSEILIASKYDIPEDWKNILYLDAHAINLKEYMQDDSYKLRVKTVTDQSLANDMTIISDETFHVKARLRNYFKK
ncbi:MAG: hypothetical protein V4580_18470 [Bacteroidota bacterium]